MFIRADGDVTICGSKPYGEPVFGNINTDKLIDVWNGEEITKARETMLKGRNHLKYCRSCDNFHSPIREEVYYLNDKDIRERWGFYKKLLRTGKCNV
jgi:MoaA/NifB/PqqE/SkfB family radical SAM enzyme